MFKRLQDYVYTPNRSRRRADRWILAVSISFAWYGILSGVPAIDAAKQGLVIVIVGMIVSTCWHLTVHAATPKVTYKPDGFLLRRPILASLLTTLLFGLGGFARRIEAASINRRLRSALANSSSVSEIAKITTDAIGDDIAADPSIVDEIVRKGIETAAREPSLAPDSDVAIGLTQLNSYQAFVLTKRKLVILNVPLIHVLMPSSIFMIGGGLQARSSYIFGQRGSTVQATFDKQKSSAALTYNLDNGDAIISHMSFGGVFVGTDTADFVQIAGNGRLAVVDVAVMAFAQDLAGIIWCNVTFQDCIIRYKKGPLRLLGARFINCAFEFGTGRMAQNTLRRIQAEKTNWVNLSQEL
jgi:hypothetical protein